MELNTLTAIAPVDGRYRSQVKHLARYFSEYGLMRYRVEVEIEYFIALCNYGLPNFKNFNKSCFEDLRKIYFEFSVSDAEKIKLIEKNTNHDVKAVEYFLKEQFEKLGINEHKEFIHFGLTSQDVNNTAIPLLLKEAMQNELLPELTSLKDFILDLAKKWMDVPMLAYTHGQPASPTKLGKEFMVFYERLDKQIALLGTIPFSAKFGGATGNFNAHQVAFPKKNWEKFADEFVEKKLKLSRSRFTTQIEHYDNLAALFDNLKRINTILIDFNRDIWQYISMDYFKQRINENEVGSSTMPHKVNPIDFENSEGNLGIANALFEHFSAKLPISRLQRDLTDSTVLRNIGIPIAHSLIAYKSTLRGLQKLELNSQALEDDLNNNWAVVTEGIQTILRREGYPNPYEALKTLARTNHKITCEDIQKFILGLDVSDSVKKELLAITPFNYTGIVFE
ncbi:MAG: adenylosuccinate lyase [Cytophagaceae bacterium]|nr:adenylosuccinate lyase [Cytophagaceae bacterium]MDW8456951.1 adenylosuccinate lyase [Cytophagaceae bacterium]